MLLSPNTCINVFLVIFGFMPINKNVIANADDMGLNSTVNTAILNCYLNGYINSTSLLTNMGGFPGAVDIIKDNPIVQNVGIHINLAEGKPLVFDDPKFLDSHGNWNIAMTNRKLQVLSAAEKASFLQEMYAQTDKALANKITLTHIDSHYHIHTLPCFYSLFLHTAKHYDLKIRLAQTYREGSFIKYWFRRYINSVFIKSGFNYANRFETVEVFLKNKGTVQDQVEVMLHPDLDALGNLTDHVDPGTMANWLAYMKRTN